MRSVYYKCLSGDSAHLALTEQDSFACHDVRGRDWICYPLATDDVEQLSMLEHVRDVFSVDAALTRQGLGGGGTEIRVVLCESRAELAEKLAAPLASA